MMKERTFLFLKILIAIAAIITMYFASHFWIGTEEGWSKASDSKFWEFFISRFGSTILIGLFFLLISTFLSKVQFQKSENSILGKTILVEFLVVILAALVFTSMAVM